MRPLLEICVDHIASVEAAKAGGADRIELCAALSEGGLSPSRGLVEESLDCFGPHVCVMLRPRPGNFLYSEAERRVMARDLRWLADAGVKAVVAGALTPSGDIDRDFLLRLRELAGPLELTFHRAFDLVREPLRALDVLMELGVERLLTSGGAPSAMQGSPLIRELVQRSSGRMIVMAGAGIRPENALPLIRATGVREIHASLRKRVAHAAAQGLQLGDADDGQGWNESDTEAIAQLARLLRTLENQ